MENELNFLKELRNTIEPDLDEYHNGIIEIDTRIEAIKDDNNVKEKSAWKNRLI